MKKVIFVSHCILNTASKVVLYNQEEINAEEDLRIKFMTKLLNSGIQVIQLPCPEFTLYGSRRWGHVSNQFDNIFFRKHCRKILTPIIDQMKEYLQNPEFFKILGVVGIDGSPSCGVDYTCEALKYYGAFDSRPDLEETLKDGKMVNKPGILMAVLKEMLKEEGLEDKIKVTSLFALEPNKCLSILDD